jgi:hypothetical protein
MMAGVVFIAGRTYPLREAHALRYEAMAPRNAITETNKKKYPATLNKRPAVPLPAAGVSSIPVRSTPSAPMITPAATPAAGRRETMPAILLFPFPLRD